ncbi:MAG: hypoxanthine phosphoribosyltransferase [Planctomycetaceae bacterium]
MISIAEIEAAIDRLAAEVRRDLTVRPLTVLGVLNGSLMFVADLMRKLNQPHQLGLIQVSSYRGPVTQPGSLRINSEFLPAIAGRDVLLLDDILDTGRTLAALVNLLHQQSPASVRTAVMLWKRCRTEVDIHPDYVGFEIPDQFVVGYGLDYDGDYRHLPYIGVVNFDGASTTGT